MSAQPVSAAREPAATGPALPSTAGVPAEPWQGAPFDAALAGALRQLLGPLSAVQRAWLAGYLAGTLGVATPGMQPGPHGGLAALPRAAHQPAHPVTILYGSESGNSERLARALAARFTTLQRPARLLDMLDCRKTDLEQSRDLLVIVSTHGDGEPPANAVPLFELLASRKAPRLNDTRFAVLALGDRSYEQFCAAGRRIDTLLAQRGAQRLQPCIECDVDFAAPAQQWADAIVATLAEQAQATATPTAAPSPGSTVVQAWTRKHPFNAPVLASQPLTARGSTKQVRHVELSLEGSDIQYEPGDALGIVPVNDAAAVDALLAALDYDAAAVVPAGECPADLRSALLRSFEIGTLTPAMLRRYAEATRHTELLRLVADKDAQRAFSRGRDLQELVKQYPPRGLDAAAFAALLSPLAPRLYSIASSQKATVDEVHLTVGVVAYEAFGRARRGVVSGAIATLADDASLPVYLHRNEGFRLPADPATPIVMIGAGTGVAPYRGFLAEREAIGARGRNWLFFGDRSFELDFLYQVEWLAWRRRGLLTRLDVAFSRDQSTKVYVQHRLREQGAQLWRWLQEGAHLYVCGDATHMAPDVESALLAIASRHGGLGEDAARDYLRQLRSARRYQKDVY